MNLDLSIIGRLAGQYGLPVAGILAVLRLVDIGRLSAEAAPGYIFALVIAGVGWAAMENARTERRAEMERREAADRELRDLIRSNTEALTRVTVVLDANQRLGELTGIMQLVLENLGIRKNEQPPSR